MTASTKSLDYPGCTSSDASGTISKIYLTSLELGPTHTSFPTFISLVYEYHARSSKSWTLRPSFTRGVRCHTWALPTGGLHHNVEVRILPSAPPSKPNLVHLNKSGRGCLCGMRRVRQGLGVWRVFPPPCPRMAFGSFPEGRTRRVTSTCFKIGVWRLLAVHHVTDLTPAKRLAGSQAQEW